jgi:hypothetical protein
VEGFAEGVEKTEKRAALPLLQIDLLSSLNDRFAHIFMLNRRAISKESPVKVARTKVDWVAYFP